MVVATSVVVGWIVAWLGVKAVSGLLLQAIGSIS